MSSVNILPVNEPQYPKVVVIKPSHIKGMLKLGSVMLPTSDKFPDFKSINPEKYMNRMIDYMYEDDRGALLIILQILAISPRFIIKGLLNLIVWGSTWNGMAGAPFRMLQVALKGIIFTIYYSDLTEDKVIFNNIGWDAKIVQK